MIIRPNFLRHPKTLLLLELLGPEGVCRLLAGWTWCQESGWGEFWPKADRGYVERICVWRGKAGRLSEALVKSGWLKFTRQGALWVNWNQNNHAMVNNWKNGQFGKLGGRPKKHTKPSGLSNAKPSGLPSGLPGALPSGPPEERRGEEKRSDQKREIEESEAPPPVSSNGPSEPLQLQLDESRKEYGLLRGQWVELSRIKRPSEKQKQRMQELDDLLRHLKGEQLKICQKLKRTRE